MPTPSHGHPVVNRGDGSLIGLPMGDCPLIDFNAKNCPPGFRGAELLFSCFLR